MEFCDVTGGVQFRFDMRWGVVDIKICAQPELEHMKTTYMDSIDVSKAKIMDLCSRQTTGAAASALCSEAQIA